MEVNVSLATTGELVYSTAFSEVHDLSVWELRLQICREMASAKYFSFVLFREHELLDDTAMLAAYADSAHEGDEASKPLMVHYVTRSSDDIHYPGRDGQRK